LLSAQVVVPLVIDILHPTSVVDVGCGVGTWLRAFSENGVTVLRGLDGDYVSRAKLQINADCFVAVDLKRSFEIDGYYDLAVCLEVAEHVPAQHSRELIRRLTESAPVVLFSAAVPRQGGIGHVNEQWPGYWRKRFRDRGFTMLDPIRPFIREDSRVAWWYRQNIVLFANDTAISGSKSLARLAEGAQPIDIEWFHVSSVIPYMQPGFRNALREVLNALHRAIRQRLGRQEQVAAIEAPGSVSLSIRQNAAGRRADTLC
jgi:SAM-dependent methyltransferase